MNLVPSYDRNLSCHNSFQQAYFICKTDAGINKNIPVSNSFIKTNAMKHNYEHNVK